MNDGEDNRTSFRRSSLAPLLASESELSKFTFDFCPNLTQTLPKPTVLHVENVISLSVEKSAHVQVKTFGCYVRHTRKYRNMVFVPTSEFSISFSRLKMPLWAISARIRSIDDRAQHRIVRGSSDRVRGGIRNSHVG